MSKNKEDTESAGCLLLIGMLAIACGVGIIFGGGWGFITFGTICLSMSLIYILCD